MATETEQLVVQLEARVREFERNFERARKASNDNWRAIESRGRQAAQRIEGTFGTVAARAGTALRSSLAGYGAALAGAVSTRAIAAAAKQYVDLQNVLKITGIEGRALESTFASLFQIAQKNGTPIEALVTLYSRASQAQGELKASTQDLMRFTDGVSLALRVAGTDAQQASGALLQLGQALGSGTVRAEEFNSVNEGARPILQAVAAGLKEAGGSVATLKNLVNEGQVSSEAFFRAFLAGLPTLETAASKAQATVGQATSRMANAFVVLVGELDKTTGASRNAAENLTAVGKAIEGIPAYIQKAAFGFGELQSWLNQIGNHPFWERLARATGATFTDDEARAAGLTVIPAQKPSNPRIPEFGLSAEGRAPSASVKPVSLADYPANGKTKTGESESDRRADQINAYIERLQQSTRILQAEYETLGKSNAERARAIELARIGEVADADQLARIEAAVDANEALRRKIEETERATEGLRDAALATGAALGDALGDVIIDGREAQDVVADLARSFARMAIAAAFTGGGPLGGLIGGKGIFGGFRADGGPVTAGRAYVVGERRAELFVPNQSGTILPRVPSAPAIAGVGPGTTINAPINITIEGGAGSPEQNADLANRIGKQVEAQIRALAAREIRTQMRPGGILRG